MQVPINPTPLSSGTRTTCDYREITIVAAGFEFTLPTDPVKNNRARDLLTAHVMGSFTRTCELLTEFFSTNGETDTPLTIDSFYLVEGFKEFAGLCSPSVTFLESTEDVNRKVFEFTLTFKDAGIFLELSSGMVLLTTDQALKDFFLKLWDDYKADEVSKCTNPLRLGKPYST